MAFTVGRVGCLVKCINRKGQGLPFTAKTALNRCWWRKASIQVFHRLSSSQTKFETRPMSIIRHDLNINNTSEIEVSKLCQHCPYDIYTRFTAT